LIFQKKLVPIVCFSQGHGLLAETQRLLGGAVKKRE